MDGVQDFWEGEYTYHCILTNDYDSSVRDSVMRGRVNAIRTFKGLVADLRINIGIAQQKHRNNKALQFLYKFRNVRLYYLNFYPYISWAETRIANPMALPNSGGTALPI